MKRTFRSVASLLRVDGSLVGSKQAQLTLLLGLVVLTAGCMGLGDDSTAIQDAETIETVPAEADALAYFDSEIVDDQATTELLDGFMDIFHVGADDPEMPSTWDGVLDEIEAESDIEIGDFHAGTAFFGVEENTDFDDPAEEYAAIIVETDWQWNELTETADDDALDDIETETHNGVPLFILDDAEETTYIADFQDGTFVIGAEDAVRDAIDTRQGDMDAIDGDLKEAFLDAEDGLITFAMAVPEELEDEADDVAVEDEIGEDITVVTMVYSSAGSEMQFDMRMTFETEASAEATAQLLEFAVMFGDDEDLGEFEPLLENIQISQDGTQVTIGYGTTTDEILSLFAFLEDWNPFEFQVTDDEFASQDPIAVTG